MKPKLKPRRPLALLVAILLIFAALPMTVMGADPLNRDDLKAAYAIAVELKARVKTSTTDGNDVLTTDQWMTSAEKGALDSAISDGNTEITTEAKTTQAEIDALTAALDAAVATAKDGKMTASDFTALNEAIAAAEAKGKGVVESRAGDGTDIPITQKWVADRTVFDTAINDAKSVAAKPNATQAEIDDATRAMQAATLVFNPQAGKLVPLVYTSLDNAIKAAKAKVEGVVESADGKDIFTTVMWVKTGEKTTFSAAIAAAEAVANRSASPLPTQPEIDAAKKTLDAAIAAFKPQAGTKVKANFDALNRAIATAEAKVDGVKASDDGKDILTTEKWETQLKLTNLNTALAAAIEVAEKEDSTQTEIDKANSNLAAATSAFSPKAGTIVPANFSALNKSLADAEAKIKDVKDSRDGANVLTTEMWEKKDNIDTFKQAIADAKKVAEDAYSVQGDVDKADIDLQAAITAFKPQAGKQVPADFSGLNDALAAAEAKVKDVRPSITNGADVLTTDKWAVQNDIDTINQAIADAKQVAENAYASQSAVDAAADTLQIATINFKPKAGTKKPADFAALNEAIANAEAKAGAAKVSEDGKDVSANEKWVTQADMDALQAAIEVAKIVAEDAYTEQDAIDNAVAELNKMVEAFVSAMQNGKKISVQDIVNEGSGLKAENGMLSGLTASKTGNSLASLLSKFNVPAGYKLGVEKNGKPVTSGNVGTGMSVTITDDNGTVIETVILVVTGDLSGDGVSNVQDFALMAKQIRGISSLQGAFLAAANISGGTGNPSIRDFAGIAKMIRS